MHTLVNCKSSYFFRNYIMQQPDCTIFTLEMAHIDSDDTAVGSIKIIVFHIGRQVDVGTTWLKSIPNLLFISFM